MNSARVLVVLFCLTGCKGLDRLLSGPVQQSRDSGYDFTPIPDLPVTYYSGYLTRGSASVFTGSLENKTVLVFLDNSHEPIMFHAQNSPYTPDQAVYGIFGDTIYIVQAQSYTTYFICVSKR